MSEIKMVEVVSSNIKEVGYDEDTLTLRVTFHGNKSYDYMGVSSMAYTDLLNSESIGKHFHHNIKGVYEWNKVALPPE